MRLVSQLAVKWSFLQFEGIWRLGPSEKWSVWADGTTALTEARWIGRICAKLKLLNIVGPELILWLCTCTGALHFMVIWLQHPTNVLKHPGIIEQHSVQNSDEGRRGAGNTSQTTCCGSAEFRLFTTTGQCWSQAKPNSFFALLLSA